jgi:hypothetical protein
VKLPRGRTVIERFVTDVPQISRYATLWRKILNVKGELPPVQPEVSLESDRPEYSYAKGEYLWTIQEILNPAAQSWDGGVFNPTGSGLLVVILGAGLTTSAVLNNTIQGRFFDSPTGQTLAAPLPRDSRWFQGPNSATAGRMPFNRASAVPAAIAGTAYSSEIVRLPTPTNIYLQIFPLVLDSGHGWALLGGVETAAINYFLWGYARPFEPPELTPGQ